MNYNEVRTQVIERLSALPVHEQKIVAIDKFGFGHFDVAKDTFEDDFANLLNEMGTDTVVDLWSDLHSHRAVIVGDDVTFEVGGEYNRSLEDEARFEIEERERADMMERLSESRSGWIE
jgi:hypothetical protein